MSFAAGAGSPDVNQDECAKVSRTLFFTRTESIQQDTQRLIALAGGILLA